MTTDRIRPIRLAGTADEQPERSSPPAKVPATGEPQRSQKAVKPPKPRKVEKRQRGRKG